MSPRKNEGTDVTRPPVLGVDDAESSRVSNQNSQPASEYYLLLLSNSRGKASASGNRPPTYEEEIKLWNRLHQEFSCGLERANSVPLSDLLANSEDLIAEFEALIARLEALNAKLRGVQKQCTKSLARRMTVFDELEHVSEPRLYDTRNLKLATFLDRVRDGRSKLLEMGESHQEVPGWLEVDLPN